MPTEITAAKVLDFWFKEATPKQWWSKDAVFDATIRQRFERVHASAVACELWHWRGTPSGRLAEIIVLDQFSRNLFRDDARAFAADALALALAQEAVRGGHDAALPVTQRAFLYMPYMHSESLAIHDEARRLFAAPGLESNADFEGRHRAILERFGRYPHRNAALGRASTAAESAFLKEPGSSF
jgi:uncharacterized protein (DUF924 family)